MALPDKPLTRAEEYLHNIATGDGVIPEKPYTRIEQYLDYIAQNGGGGGSSGAVDGAFSTTSENPLQNKVITAAFNAAAQELDAKPNASDITSAANTVHSYQYNPDTNYFDSDVLFQRVGNVVEVRYVGKLTLAATTFIEIVNFAPDGFKPADPTNNKLFPVCLLCFVPSGNNGRFLFRLFKGGKLSMYNYGGAMAEGMFYMSGTYITEDAMPST